MTELAEASPAPDRETLELIVGDVFAGLLGDVEPPLADVDGGGPLPVAGLPAHADSSTHRPGSSSDRMVASSLETPLLYTPALGPVRKMAA